MASRWGSYYLCNKRNKKPTDWPFIQKKAASINKRPKYKLSGAAFF